MKEIIITDEQLPSSEELKKMLFGDVTDPRSMAYERVLIRPAIPWGKIVLSILGAGAFLTLVIWGVMSVRLPSWAQWLISGAVIFLFLLIHLKRISICAVRIYQRFAPEDVRKKCRFEPSCSAYMILAIEKYGVFRGIRKGINRLRRCNVNNGGYDDP